jgi:hypothetical protein
MVRAGAWEPRAQGLRGALAPVRQTRPEQRVRQTARTRHQLLRVLAIRKFTWDDEVASATGRPRACSGHPLVQPQQLLLRPPHAGGWATQFAERKEQ